MLRDTDLHPETRRKLGLPETPKKRGTKADSFTREHLRREALGILANIRQLSTSQRRQVLNFALKLNAV
jgi:hypothetical protein